MLGHLARTGCEDQPSSVMLSNPDLAAAFKTSVYNTVQFSAATSKAMGMTRVPSPPAPPTLCLCSELQQLGLLLQLPPDRDGERHHPGGRPLQPLRPRHRHLALAAARVISHVYYQHSGVYSHYTCIITASTATITREDSAVAGAWPCWGPGPGSSCSSALVSSRMGLNMTPVSPGPPPPVSPCPATLISMVWSWGAGLVSTLLLAAATVPNVPANMLSIFTLHILRIHI